MELFVNLHKNQLESSNVPEVYWPTLFNKLTNEILDVGEYFMMAQVIEEDEDGNEIDGVSWKIVVNVDELTTADANSIFLIDHAWTYRADEACRQLRNDRKLLLRMADLMGVCTENCQDDVDDIVEKVFSEMWRFNQTYSIGNDNLGCESASPIWYVMDEFGSRVQHSDSPTVKMVPFCYAPTKTAFTLMWPIQDLKRGDEVTRDCVNMPPNVSSKFRRFLLSPWVPLGEEDDDDDEDKDGDSDEIFNSKFSVHTSLPTIQDHHQDLSSLHRKLKVFTDVEQVCDHLKHPAFSLIDSLEEADIIWTKHYLSDFKSFSEETPNKLINQFPFEMVLTIKNMLYRVCKNDSQTSDGQKTDSDLDLADVTKSPNPDHHEFPNWLAVTFDLRNELAKFIRYFRRREKSALCNYWIVKPYNLSRGLDSHVTGNVNQIVRLLETGPKVACLYIDDPVLLSRKDVGLVKFDLRFIVMLISLQPLKLAVHKKFLIRVANREFSMRNFDEYEQHFTVMNYKPGAKMHIIACEEMEQRFADQYPSFGWNDVLSDIYGMISEMFKRASRLPPPRGIGHCPQSRTIYGVDVMLKWNKRDNRPATIQPVVLECNFGPDNTRFLRSYPTFFDDIFETLFLNSQSNPNITYITC
ncbi:hypothetical protein HELRODRAFT_185510 [Helobdella robusta]|uniref:Tubulin--tyrosine ligase-like protein 12 SET-like domain-containing protein n=1 Tax=Helobdella robusta TaxID=6412 RepID=T1FMW9_HELRO|nr:hypothetical protein HELRODRAFT_185510 [Helobdella robusta]ESO05228.1 hypothetical protein HELRODRAFT_185510 [Helobdella robusta]